jgi:hypothetical protein
VKELDHPWLKILFCPEEHAGLFRSVLLVFVITHIVISLRVSSTSGDLFVRSVEYAALLALRELDRLGCL